MYVAPSKVSGSFSFSHSACSACRVKQHSHASSTEGRASAEQLSTTQQQCLMVQAPLQKPQQAQHPTPLAPSTRLTLAQRRRS